MKMSILNLPSYKLYWVNQIRYHPVADIMPLKRYEKLKQYLHFVYNTTYDANHPDKLFKINPSLML